MSGVQLSKIKNSSAIKPEVFVDESIGKQYLKFFYAGSKILDLPLKPFGRFNFSSKSCTTGFKVVIEKGCRICFATPENLSDRFLFVMNNYSDPDKKLECDLNIVVEYRGSRGHEKIKPGDLVALVWAEKVEAIKWK